MTNVEIYNYYESIPKGSRSRTITDHFNSLDVTQRKSYIDFLYSLPDGDKKAASITRLLRNQAVDDFWENERQSILKDGKGSRDWTPEQIEQILNFDENGNMKSSAGVAQYLDDAGNLQSYQGHHLLNVDAHPEYAGDWRNIQPLTASEHISGAHAGNTHIPTSWYYDADTNSYFLIDGTTVDFDTIEYVPKVESVFKSDAEMALLFENYDLLTDGEKYTLKYIDCTIDNEKTLTELMDVYDYTSKYGSEKFNDITIYINDDGNIIQSSLKNSGETASSSVKYTANIAELKEFGLIDDVELTRRIGDEFEGLTFAQRWQMKEYFTYHCALEDLLLDPMNPAAQAA